MKKIAMIMTILVVISGCQKRSKKGFELRPPNTQGIDPSILPAEGKPITIFIHGGARPISSLLALPGLHSSCPPGLALAKDLGADCALGRKVCMVLSNADPEGFPRDSFYNFGWSGYLSFAEREKAGQDLYDVLCQLRADKRYAQSKITIFSFSHGGNVALNAGITAAARGDCRQLVDLLIMTACPVVVPTQDFVTSSIFGKVISLYSKSDSFQVLDPQGFYPEMTGLPCSVIFSQRRFDAAMHLVQAEVKINNRSQTGHLGFVAKTFLRAMPKVIELLLDEERCKKLPRYKNESYCITINTKDGEVTGCKSLREWHHERKWRPITEHARVGCKVCERLLQSKRRRSPRSAKARRAAQSEEA